MRYIKHHLETIDNVSIYPMISLMIFFLFFLALTIIVVRTRKNHVTYMSNLPLEQDDLSGESSKTE